MAKFFRIECVCEKKQEQGRRCRPNYIGAIQVDTPNITHHHCRMCNTTYEHAVDANGTLSRRKIPIEERIDYTESTNIVRVIL
jgi:hypothetical protein